MATGTSASLKLQYCSGLFVLTCAMEHGSLTSLDPSFSVETSCGDSTANYGRCNRSFVMSNLARFDIAEHAKVREILSFVFSHTDGVSLDLKASSAATLRMFLPFEASPRFANFFRALDDHMGELSITGYGISMPTFESVFLAVGGNFDLAEREDATDDGSAPALGSTLRARSEDGIRHFRTHGFVHGLSVSRMQVHGMFLKRLQTSLNDPARSLPLLGFPPVVALIAYILNITGTVSYPGNADSNLVTALMIAIGYLPIVSLIAEAVVLESTSNIRNVITVAGCEVRAYWLGTLAGDMALLAIVAVLIYIIGVACAFSPTPVGDDASEAGSLEHVVAGGKLLWLILLASAHIVSFCYFTSFSFGSARVAVATLPMICIVLVLLPVIFVGLFFGSLGPPGANLLYMSDQTIFLNILRGIMVCDRMVIWLWVCSPSVVYVKISRTRVIAWCRRSG